MNEEDDIDAMLAEIEAANDKGVESEAQATFKVPKKTGGVVGWMQRLPTNVGVGLIDAALAAKHTLDEITPNDPDPILPPSADYRRQHPDTLNNYLRESEDKLFEFRNSLAKESSTADSVTQGVAQFAVPFIGWTKYLKALGAGKTLAAVGAEAAAVGSSFEPDAGRLADLIELGRHTEGRLGDAMRAASPDGSLLNSYINYMTDREGESEGEARFKNVVDSLAMSAAVAGIFKTGALAIKTGRRTLAAVRTPAPPSPPVVEPVLPPEPTISFEADVGGDSVVKASGEAGYLKLRPANGGYRVRDAFVAPEARGKKLGVKLYEEAIRRAEARGGALDSDTVVSKEAQRVYDSLERRGYEVTRNPATPFDDEALQSDNSLRPVYSVKKRATQTPTQ